MKKTQLSEGQSDIFDLTKEQKKKFAALKRAYNACIKARMMPVNYYGTLEFYDLDFIDGYGNRDSGFDDDLAVLADFNHSSRGIDIPNEWTDDSHLFLLTETGMKLYRD